MEFTLERWALILAHFIYRNTAIEDLHTKGVVMDERVYNTMYKVVTDNLRKVKRNQKILLNIRTDTDLRTYCESTSSARAVELCRYMTAIHEESLGTRSSHWDPPQLLNVAVGTDLAAFVLAGNFRAAVHAGMRLDNHTMAFINKDVLNRVYTLLHKGLL